MMMLLAIVGFALSAYAFSIDLRLHKNPTFHPACDLSKNVSCSKAFKSPYGRLFVFPNSVWGMLFYVAVLFTGSRLLISLGVFASLFLAYVSYVLEKNICPVCTLVYLVNFLLVVI